jgi:hypothetical protein
MGGPPVEPKPTTQRSPFSCSSGFFRFCELTIAYNNLNFSVMVHGTPSFGGSTIIDVLGSLFILNKCLPGSNHALLYPPTNLPTCKSGSPHSVRGPCQASVIPEADGPTGHLEIKCTQAGARNPGHFTFAKLKRFLQIGSSCFRIFHCRQRARMSCISRFYNAAPR